MRTPAPSCPKYRSSGRFLKGLPLSGRCLGNLPRKKSAKRTNTTVRAALAERPPKLERKSAEDGKVPYNWQTEWYPVYITEQMPKDRPMAFTLFDTPLVLFYDGTGKLSCVEDRCPHRAAKLSEGQIIDGKLECLYHGWQFEGDGSCSKIPQLTDGAAIPRAACVRTYTVRDRQGVVWVWMGKESEADESKLPYWNDLDMEGFRVDSHIHDLPYDSGILLENLMDPAHIPISHDKTDPNGRREDAQALWFDVTERTDRGFAGGFGMTKPRADGTVPGFTGRFVAPCVFNSRREWVDKKGNKVVSLALILCPPTGQGKSRLIIRFGSTLKMPPIPKFFIHSIGCKVFEQDMGLLSSQNELLVKANQGVKDLYLPLKSSDGWVIEYRKWLDKVGHGMPYYTGYSTFSPPRAPAVVDQAPVGSVAAIAANNPAFGSLGAQYALDPTNRYIRHVVHCKDCRKSLKTAQTLRSAALVLAAISGLAGIAAAQKSARIWGAAGAGACLLVAWGAAKVAELLTTNFVRDHRKL
ncbi:translocon at the inner envelope membrane of chloroplast TIC55 [Klebsormidium nitens]|uniref:Translocon at the inner envelope membrane of chloroplast TIC55 n=1 Tax=Klebsormidium nitens TaxID=105231 RepID=A0A0U9HHW0_KLENI|nr:translocon at the inner envelope membrane of chloroplast TIC55 [Klebsormidium nitens]|eukprot:GAQ77973.1 translocon at the inner envelope membrane of chloroplast TIC55 [Klebsormidium nitens]